MLSKVDLDYYDCGDISNILPCASENQISMRLIEPKVLFTSGKTKSYSYPCDILSFVCWICFKRASFFSAIKKAEGKS